MPLHRYECEVCQHRFRVLVLDGQSPAGCCPACGSDDVRRMLPRVAVQFKGNGYYKTDRARKTHAAAASPSVGSEAGAASGVSSED